MNHNKGMVPNDRRPTEQALWGVYLIVDVNKQWVKLGRTGQDFCRRIQYAQTISSEGIKILSFLSVYDPTVSSSQLTKFSDELETQIAMRAKNRNPNIQTIQGEYLKYSAKTIVALKEAMHFYHERYRTTTTMIDDINEEIYLDDVRNFDKFLCNYYNTSYKFSYNNNNGRHRPSVRGRHFDQEYETELFKTFILYDYIEEVYCFIVVPYNKKIKKDFISAKSAGIKTYLVGLGCIYISEDNPVDILRQFPSEFVNDGETRRGIWWIKAKDFDKLQAFVEDNKVKSDWLWLDPPALRKHVAEEYIVRLDNGEELC